MSGLTGRPTSSRHGGRTLFEHDALVRPTGDVDSVLADAADWSRRGAANDVGGCAAPPDIGTNVPYCRAIATWKRSAPVRT